MARQTKVKSEKSAKHCSLCGARTWMWDDLMMRWSGPWHFNWCSEVPGGDEKRAADIEHDIRYAEEKVVPREMGGRILKAITLMVSAPGERVQINPEGTTGHAKYKIESQKMEQLKAAIQERLGKI